MRLEKMQMERQRRAEMDANARNPHRGTETLCDMRCAMPPGAFQIFEFYLTDAKAARTRQLTASFGK